MAFTLRGAVFTQDCSLCHIRRFAISETIQAIAEAFGMTVDIIDPKLADLAPLRKMRE